MRSLCICAVIVQATVLSSTGGRCIDFEAMDAGSLPAEWIEVNSDRRLGSNWAVLPHLNATSGVKVFAKTAVLPASAPPPMALWGHMVLKDGAVQVKIKPMGGRGRRVAGLVFRHTGPDDYWLATADPLTGEVTIRRRDQGRESILAMKPAAFRPNQTGWTQFRVVFDSTRVRVFVNGRICAESRRRSAGAGPGRAGLYAAPGAFMMFDDFEAGLAK